MQGLSPWYRYEHNDHNAVLLEDIGSFTFSTVYSDDSLWISIKREGKEWLALRAGYFPGRKLHIERSEELDSQLLIEASNHMARYRIQIRIPDPSLPLVHYTTTLIPAADMTMPFWPRDVIISADLESKKPAEGTVHVQQVGIRSGLIHFSVTGANSSSALYFQNLTALNEYAAQTKTSLADTVGGQWPEIGLGLPPATGEPLKKDQPLVINDAYVLVDEAVPASEFEIAKQFMDMLASVYLHLPLPQTKYNNWQHILEKTRSDLEYNPGCWYRAGKHSYLNAYLSDYKTPPEIMVQLAVLLPLMDYEKWSKEPIKMISRLKDGLHAFYDEKIKAAGRWLPAAQGILDRSEEHKKPRVMDAWYLHHPLLNLARMVKSGEEQFRELLLNSVEFAIKVAHQFNYEWPVFYHLDTLEIIKPETQPGKGGEKDVAGIYAQVMLLVWEVTKDDRYLEEAKKAGRSLQGKGLSMFYQANNTSFAAKALLRLYIITKEELYLNLSYVALASIFKNVWLWDCNYGYAKHYPTFFALFPLNDAPYTAVYEEQEVLSGFRDYLVMAQEVEAVPPYVHLLLSEYTRHMVFRCASYYPPLIPGEVLAKEHNSGEVDDEVWIPLEDLQDGWKQSGMVGQEVYGAGLPFGVVPRQYKIFREYGCQVFLDYPSAEKETQLEDGVSFDVYGDPRLYCSMLLMPLDGSSIAHIRVKINNQPTEGKYDGNGNIEFSVPGKSTVELHCNKQHNTRASCAVREEINQHMETDKKTPRVDEKDRSTHTDLRENDDRLSLEQDVRGDKPAPPDDHPAGEENDNQGTPPPKENFPLEKDE